MDAAALLRAQFSQAHQWLDATIGEASDARLYWCDPDGIAPVVAHYAHVVVSEDIILTMIVRGETPLLMSSWADRTGLSEPPAEDDWSSWARRVRVDLAQFRPYAQAVYAETDAYLAALNGADLDREFDSSPLPFGRITVGNLASILCGHVYMHAGEISMVKGLQGLRGYPI